MENIDGEPIERFWDFLDEQPVEPTDSRELNIDNCIEC